MTKRMMAVVIMLVSLLVCCCAFAGSTTEANIKDNQKPVIGEVKLSKAKVLLKVPGEDEEEPENNPTDTVEVKVAVTDNTCSPDNLSVDIYAVQFDKDGNFVCVVGGNGSTLCYNTKSVSLKYDNVSGMFVGKLTFDKFKLSGNYHIVACARDVYANNTGFVDTGAVITLTNEWELAVPVIDSFKLSETGVKFSDDKQKVCINLYVKAHFQKDKATVPYTGSNYEIYIYDKNGDEVEPYDMRYYRFYDGEADAQILFDVKQLEPAYYTVKLVLYDEHYCVCDTEILTVKIDPTFTKRIPVVTDVYLDRNGQILTTGENVELSANVTNVAHGSHLIAKFVNQSNGLFLNLNLKYSQGKFGCNEQLQANSHYEGEYQLECITYNGIVVYTPAEPITFTYQEDGVNNIANIVLNNVDTGVGEIEMILGSTFKVDYTVIPEDPTKPLTNPGVVWGSDDENVASVDENGVITANTEGTTCISLKSANGLVYTFGVVVKYQFIENVYCKQQSPKLVPGATLQLDYTVEPAGVTRGAYHLESSNPLVATVDENGLVTALAEGSTKISLIETKSNYQVDHELCFVTVAKQLTEEIVINQQNIYLNLLTKPTYTLEYTATPADVTTPGVKWYTDDENVAVVDQNGVVTAVGEGRTCVYAKAIDGSGKEGHCYVDVEKDVTKSIHLSTNELTMEYKPNAATPATFDLDYIALPDSIYAPGVVWTSSNTNAAVVDQNGVVTAVGEGEAIITATAADNAIVYDSCTVTVKVTAVTAIALPHKKITLRLSKGTVTLKPTVTPETCRYKLRWSSSNPKVATVKNGVVTAKKVGVCRITCTVKGTQLSATVRVKVVK